jgi:hypothetical protein
MNGLTPEQHIEWYARRVGYPSTATVTYDDRSKAYVLRAGTTAVYCGRNFQEATGWLSRRHEPMKR